MMRILLLLLSLALTSSAYAQAGLNIAAVVGDEAISSYDVDARLRFVIATTGLSDNEETRTRIRPQVIRALIDERLQLAAAQKKNITVSDAEVSDAVANIEKQRNMAPGGIARMLAAGSVPRDTFTQQIRTQLAWHKLLTKTVRPGIRVSDEEAARAQKRLETLAAAAAVKRELEIGLITVPVDKPKREAELFATAKKLVGEIRAGASFEEVARQFGSNTAAAGGKVQTFWVRPEQMQPAMAKALAGLSKGSVSNPVRTPDGFTIAKIYDTRVIQSRAANDTEITLKDIALTLKAEASDKEAEALLAIGQEVARNPGACEEKGVAGLQSLAEFDIEVNLRSERISDLSPALREIVVQLKPGEISPPFATERGIQLYMLCGKRAVSATAMDIGRVKTILMQEQIEREAQKYLRHLRRDTYIEIRG